MKIVSERLTVLRNSIRLSQKKLATKLGITQSSLNRYEHDQSEAPYETLLLYADYFDVSMDYIFGRTNNPQGRAYDYKPTIGDDDEMRQFIEMCFDPKSPMSTKLKETLFQMMKGGEAQ